MNAAIVHPWEPPLSRNDTMSKICKKAKSKKNYCCIPMFGCLVNAMGRQQANCCCELACTSSSKDVFDQYSVPEDIKIIHQESTTRKLAFAGLPTGAFTTIHDDEKKVKLGEFYNNSTLTFVAKFFSTCVLCCALFILLTNMIEWEWYSPENNSNR
uniref:Uncharacterized protein n=1 Tax=Acrobeloides nanus TaxID=290746 RepID=A0A914EJY9_9BILA